MEILKLFLEDESKQEEIKEIIKLIKLNLKHLAEFKEEIQSVSDFVRDETLRHYIFFIDKGFTHDQAMEFINNVKFSLQNQIKKDK